MNYKKIKREDKGNKKNKPVKDDLYISLRLVSNPLLIGSASQVKEVENPSFAKYVVQCKSFMAAATETRSRLLKDPVIAS